MSVSEAFLFQPKCEFNAMKIGTISESQTLPLRNDILRPGKDVAECIFPGDDLATTKHFAAMSPEQQIIGIVSVYWQSNPAIDATKCYQIRAMATDEAHRQKGLGILLLQAAEEYAKSQGADVIWANARQSAVGFYHKAGYQLASDEFVIPDVGPHYLVTKSLANLSNNCGHAE